MPDWLHRLHRSRRARFLTFGAIGLVWLGSCSGALLANYTVAGMNTLPYTGGQMAQSDWREDEPEWVREAAMKAGGGDTDRTAGFSSAATEAYSDAAY